LQAKKSVFNRIVGEGSADGLELAFAAFLEGAEDVQAFGKNYMAVGFKIDYVKASGELSTYTPDFIVRTKDGAVWIAAGEVPLHPVRGQAGSGAGLERQEPRRVHDRAAFPDARTHRRAPQGDQDPGRPVRQPWAADKGWTNKLIWGDNKLISPA
jgi:hypothetical protein